MSMGFQGNGETMGLSARLLVTVLVAVFAVSI